MNLLVWIIGRTQDGKRQLLEDEDGNVRGFQSQNEAAQYIRDNDLGEDCLTHGVSIPVLGAQQ